LAQKHDKKNEYILRVAEVFFSTIFWKLQKLLPLHPQQLQGEEEG